MKKKMQLKRKPEIQPESSDSEDDGQDLLDMVEDEDLEFIRKSITTKSYNIFNKIKYTGSVEPKSKRRKKTNGESHDLEDTYEKSTVIEDVPKKRLLPIKTKHGIIRQEIIDDNANKEEETNEGVDDEEEEDDDTKYDESSEEFTFMESKIDTSKPVTATELLTTRNEVLRQKKIAIGSLSSTILEEPEEKVLNLRQLLNFMDDHAPEVYYTVRKLATVSLLEIFKDILPGYEIKKIVPDGVKLKKETLKLQKYEENLLLYYKKYLQKLEKNCSILIKRKGDTRKFNDEELKLAELSVQSLCSLLTTHPYFNFAPNIAQTIVPFLNSSNRNVREIVVQSITTIFKEDKKEEITLKILRIINSYLRTHAHNVHCDMLGVLLALNLKDVNLDQEKEQDIKQKKLTAKKHKVLEMSKKERKRKKKLQELEKELLETKAEENKQLKYKNLTEIIKIVFGIYFRILKTSTNTKILGVCLEGLAKYSHCINIDFYIDLINILNQLMNEDWIGYREQLHCMQTVFAITNGQNNDIINIDPTRFYINLYKNLLITHSGHTYNNFPIVLQTIIEALIKRRKKITNKRLIGFVKRLTTLSLQLLHNGTISCLSIVKNLIQLNRSIDILLDLDTDIGDGKFQPDLDDPEYSNATSTALYELFLLNHHYHPIVNKFAKNIAFNVPATGEGSLPVEYGKCTPEQLFENFNMSEMAFNPPVPPPSTKTITPSKKIQRHQFVDLTFENYCKEIMDRSVSLF